MMTKVLKDLKEEENMIWQTKSSIEKIDRKIKGAQNPSIHFFDVAHTTFITIARFVATDV